MPLGGLILNVLLMLLLGSFNGLKPVSDVDMELWIRSIFKFLCWLSLTGKCANFGSDSGGGDGDRALS